MKQVKRNITFEINSSSVHCLTVLKDVEPARDLHKLCTNIYPYNEDEICQPEHFATLIGKLRYLWTLICCAEEWSSYREQVDEMKSMLKSIFPLVVFCDIEKVAYLEDFDACFDYELFYNEEFIRKWLTDGDGYYIDRDDPNTDYLRDMIYQYECDNINRDTICWEG